MDFWRRKVVVEPDVASDVKRLQVIISQLHDSLNWTTGELQLARLRFEVKEKEVQLCHKMLESMGKTMDLASGNKR
jgi:hypothetical protein